jgi:SpoVK/Ycf46/Vps4 family AAA+-type ATPase
VDVNDGDLRNLADACVGYVAADLAALVRRSTILAIERFFHNVDDQSSNDDRTSTISIQDLVNATNDIGASCLRDASLSAPPKTTWDDIAGDAGGAKQALRQAIEWPRTWKEAFKALGLSPPRGVLLHGPPGCAKTTLARAAAGSAGVAFLSLSPADVYSSSYVGEAESVVRRAFDLARSAAPCVLFFDELDSIIGGEDEGSGHGMDRGSSAEARVLSTFLNEMDGVDGSVEDGVLVLGATNRPGTLDAALLRPGRFDRVIYVPPPDECGRKDILRMECSKWYESILNANGEDSQKVDDSTIDDYFNLSLLATNDITGWMTGAELVGACRETAVSVMRNVLMSQSHTVSNEIRQNISNELLNSLKTELEYTLRKTQPLLSDASVLEEYTRFEEEHK